MTGRLIVHVIRTRALVLAIMTGFLSLLWASLGSLAHARAMAESTSLVAQRTNEIASGLAVRPGGWFLLLTTTFAGPAIAFSVFNSRAFFVFPVSSWEYWRARWLVGTIGVATCAVFARFAGFALSGIFAGPAVGPEALAITWLLTFVYCGAYFGIVAIVATTPWLAKLFRRLITSAPLPVRLFGAAAMGAAVTLIVAFFVLQSWRVFGWASVLGTAVAGLLTIRGYWHDPANASTAVADLTRGSVTDSTQIGRRTVGGHLTGLRLLLWRELLWTCGAASMFLVFVLIPRRTGLGGALPTFAHELSTGLNDQHGGMIGWLPAVWLFLLVLSGRNGLVPLRRQLRALPISAVRFDAMFVGVAAVYWLSVMAMFTIVMLVTTGTVPHLAISSFVLCIGITAIGHSFQLAAGLVFGGWTEVVLAVVVGQLAAWMAPLGLSNRPLVAGLGVVLVIAALFVNLPILTRSATYRRRQPGRLSIEGARA
jgi:hypothetical protein